MYRHLARLVLFVSYAYTTALHISVALSRLPFCKQPGIRSSNTHFESSRRISERGSRRVTGTMPLEICVKVLDFKCLMCALCALYIVEIALA